MPTTFNYSGKPAYMYDSAEDVWFQIGGAIDTSSGYTWTGTHVFSNDVIIQMHVSQKVLIISKSRCKRRKVCYSSSWKHLLCSSRCRR